jgi:hypothetical protein
MHAVGQQSPVETLCITVAKQGNNGSDQCFLCGLTPAARNSRKNCCFLRGLVRRNNVEVFSLGSGPEAI